MPQELVSIRRDQTLETRDLARSVAPLLFQGHRREPEFGHAASRADVDVGWLVRTLFSLDQK